jgi:hypothetical protein
MWGAPSTGKTTFLAALHVALLRQEPAWNIMGTDPKSADALVRLTTLLAERGDFPVATGDIEHYRWVLIGPAERAGRRWFGRVQRGQRVEIQLELVDSPGAAIGPGAREDLIDDLAKSSAIIFLYDPVREFEAGDAYQHISTVLAQLSRRTSGPGERLPHYVAVCITKFDEERVLRTAEKLDLLVTDPDPPGFPRVAEEDAREFFIEICQASRSGEASLIPALLERTFRRDRIRYFVTSSIGFYVDPEKGAYDPDDYQNKVPDPQGPRVRGPIRPINVLEPILWLGRQVTKQAEEAASKE